MNKVKSLYLPILSAIFALVLSISLLPTAVAHAEDIPAPGTETVTYTNILLPSNAKCSIWGDAYSNPFLQYDYGLIDILPFTYLQYSSPGNFTWYFPNYSYDDDTMAIDPNFTFVSATVSNGSAGDLTTFATISCPVVLMGIGSGGGVSGPPYYTIAESLETVRTVRLVSLGSSYSPSTTYGNLVSVTTLITESDADLARVSLRFNYDNDTSWLYTVVYTIDGSESAIWFSAGELTVMVNESSGPNYDDLVFDSQQVYDRGFRDGKAEGDAIGYNRGFAAAERLYRDTLTDGPTFFALISALVDVPVNAFTNLFNFDFLGVNIFAFLCACLTIAFIAACFKLFRR